MERGSPWVTHSLLSRDSGYTFPWRWATSCTICLYQLKSKHAPQGNHWRTIYSMANLERLLNTLYVFLRKRNLRISHPVNIPSSPSTSVVMGFLSPTCAPEPNIIPNGVVLLFLALAPGRECVSAVTSKPFPVDSYSSGISYYTSTPPPEPYYATLYVHLPSSSYTPFPTTLRLFSMHDPSSRWSCSSASDNWYLLYSSRVDFTDPFMTGPNM